MPGPSQDPSTTDLRDRLQLALGTAYTLDRELGGGGMSRVFTAQETALGRTVVVKVLPPELAAGVSIERLSARSPWPLAYSTHTSCRCSPPARWTACPTS